MKLKVAWQVSLKIKEAMEQVDKAVEKGLRDSVTKIANTTIKESPNVTGHNARSIAYKIGSKVTRRGKSKSGEKPFFEGDPDLKRLEGAIYSTSGYGGYLETGTSKMPARPYFRKALDLHIKDLPKDIKAHL